MHWTRKTIYTILTIFILAYFLYFYVQNIFLPVQFKRFVTAQAREYLQRNVSVEEIHFSPLKGFIVRNITVYQKDDPTRVFLRADEVAFHVLLAPMLWQKLILIPSIRVNGPFAQITREDTNRWNFSDLLAPPTAGPTARKSSGPGSWTIAARKILVEDGEIAYTDRTTAENFHEVVSGIRLDARLSLNKIIRFTLGGKIPRRPTSSLQPGGSSSSTGGSMREEESSVDIKGNYDIGARELSSRILARRIPLARYLSLVALPPGISLEHGVITTLDMNLNWSQKQRRRLQAQGSLTLQDITLNLADGKKIITAVEATGLFLTWQKGHWKAGGHLESPAAHVTLGGDQSFDGKISADIKSLDVSPEGVSAEGSLTLTEAQIMPGENQTIRAQNLRADHFVVRNDGRGIRLQAALDAEGLDAAFPGGRQLRGHLTTQKTKLAFDKGRLGVLSDLQLTGGRLDWNPPEGQYLQADIKSRQTLLTCEQGACQVKSDLGLENARLQLTPQIALEGSHEVNLTYQYEPNEDGPPQHQYAGEVRFTDAVIRDVPYVHAVERLRGTLRFETNRLATDQLSFQTQGTDIELAGSLIDFGQPVLNIRAKTDNLDLQKFFAAFPVLTEKTNITAAGTAAVEAFYLGAIQSPAAADIRINARPRGAAITSPKIPPPEGSLTAGSITDISGEIDYRKDLVVCKDLRGSYQKKSYTLNGRLADFSRPVVDIEVASADLSAAAQIKILNQAFQIIFLTGKYFNSAVDVKGDVHLREGGEPDLDIRGTFALSLEDLHAFSPALKDRFPQLQPVGTISGEGLFKGKPENWRDWDLTFTARAPTVSLNGFYLDEVDIQYEQRDRHVSKCNLTGRVYNGSLNITSSADLAPEDAVAQFTGSLEALDLAALRKSDLAFAAKNKFLAGRLSALVHLNGVLKDPPRWKGGGTAAVADGHLWHWNILDGILSMLLIQEFKEVIFTDGQADFTVADGKISTADAAINSESISLKGQGWIDFAGNIDFDIAPAFGELAAIESPSLKKVPSLLLAQGGDYVAVRLTGTLRNPRYKVQTLPFKVLEKTTDILKEGGGILKEGIGTILKEIF